jgi:hypothetical protein
VLLKVDRDNGQVFWCWQHALTDALPGPSERCRMVYVEVRSAWAKSGWRHGKISCASIVCSGSGERPNFYRRLRQNRLDKSQSKKIRKYYFLELQDVPQSQDGNTSRRRRVEV